MTRHRVSPTAAGENTDTLINECLNISNYMYFGQYISYQNTPLPGNINLEPLVIGGKTIKYTNAQDGLFEEAFITPGTGRNRQIVIGYEGTNLYNTSNPNYYEFTGGQVVDDACIAAGQLASSFQPSANFAARVLGIARGLGIAKSNVFVTGHSLGAAEAEYAAAATGLSGYTFGTPGIVAPATAKASTLTNFVDVGDPVANYANDGQNAYGPKTYTGVFKNSSYPRIILSNSIMHYQSLTPLGPASNYDDLQDAVQDYNYGTSSSGYEADSYYASAAADFIDSLQYHALTNYETDLKAKYGNSIVLDSIGTTGDGSIGADSNFIGLIAPAAASAVMCFASGTLINTTRGDVAVENLVVGDRAIVASGVARPIRWLGHRTIACRGASPSAMPVRIAAGAFGDELPRRDLYLSPGHPVLVGAEVDGEGGHLVPIMCLINGTTIARADLDEVTYWHVELDQHDILLAEGLAAESYLDLGNGRTFFSDGVDDALADPDFAVPGLAGRCRSVATDGPVVEAERRRLDAVFTVRLAGAAAWPSLQNAHLSLF